jgi:hypothetical protein
MKIILTLGMAFLTLTIYAQQTLKILTDVNVQWSVTEWQTQLTLAEGADHQEKIKVHLLETVRYLKSRSTSALSPIQLHNRKQAINQLEAYTSAGKFPQNEYLPYKTPIFIDNYNTHCAVGYLMQQSGDEPLAQAISTAENFQYVKDIKTQGVNHWASENGFILEELALIQPSYFEPVNSISKINFTTTSPIITMVSEDSYTFMLTEDTFFTQYNQTFNANYLIGYDLNGRQAVSCNYPKSAPRPHTIAVAGGILYAATHDGLYLANIKNKRPQEYTWQRHTTITYTVKQINVLEDEIYFVLNSQNYSLVYNTFNSTMDTCFGTSSLGSFHLVGEGLGSRRRIYVKNDRVGHVYEMEGFQDEIGNWKTRISSEPRHTFPSKIKKALFFDNNDFYAGSFYSNSELQIQGGVYINLQNYSHFGSFFDSDSASNDWNINDLISTDGRLFVLGKFSKSNKINTLPGKAIIEVTRQGSDNYYATSVTSMFDEVYAAADAGTHLILSTNLGLYKIKHKLANTSNLKENNINLYPNPINNGQTFTIDLATIKIVKLIDNMGRIILESTSGSVTIPEGTSAGLYQCHIETTEGSFYNERVMID